MEENTPFYSRLNGGINQSDKRKRKRVHGPCIKGNLKANNYMLSRGTVLGICWLWLGWPDSMSISRKGKALLELWLNFDSARKRRDEENASFTWSLPAWWGFTVSLSNLLFSNFVHGPLQSSKRNIFRVRRSYFCLGYAQKSIGIFQKKLRCVPE